MSYLFPVDTCVVACSGPSLNKVDVFSLGLPVCAISTTIRTIKEPHYWFIADHLNEMHGEEGKIAWDNPNVTKVVPNKSLRSAGKNVVQHEYHEGREANRHYETLLFDAHKPILRGPHKTLTFAIQWLHVCGVKNLIFAGNDLTAENFESKYAYPITASDKKKQHNFKKTLDQIRDAIISWYPIAKSKGFNWYSWDCGPIFEAIVPKYTPEVLNTVVYRSNQSVVQNIQSVVPEQMEEPIREKERDRNNKEYFRLMGEARSKPRENAKVNMGVYFDLLHKRKK